MATEVGVTDLHKAIFTLWNERVHNEFLLRRPDPDESPLHISQITGPSLFDAWGGSAAYPFVILNQADTDITQRMSGAELDEQRIIHRVPISFTIYAQESATESAALIASELAEAIRETFGGHPTKRPAELCMDSNAHVYTQFQSEESEVPMKKDFPFEGAEDKVWLIQDHLMEWTLHYDFFIEHPVKVMTVS